MQSTKPYTISKQAVLDAYKKVKANRGAAGVDEETIGEFEQNLKGNLYKIWNRMSSGSYFPPAVRHVDVDDAFLASRLASEKIEIASRFFSQDIAEDAISKCIKINRDKVRQFVKNKNALRLELHASCGRSIGVGMIKGCGTETVELTDVLVVLQKNGNRFHILTAYPKI